MSIQTSFLAIAHSTDKKQIRTEKFLNEMDTIIPWGQLITKINKHYVERELGRKRKELLMMIKIYFLQLWYNLSDPMMEEWIYDRYSIQKFLGIDLMSDSVPDETTILRFRHLLEEHELQKVIFEVFKEELAKRELIFKEGTIVDATIIRAPSSTKNESKKRDPEMSSTRKGINYYFGMKVHIGVDYFSGLIHTMIGTTGSIHDKAMMNELLTNEETAILGDKGYFDEKNKSKARGDGVFYGILDRCKRGTKLSTKQKKRNRKLSSPRAKVEYPFLVIKHLWHHVKTRYKGLRKNTLQFYALAGLCNMYIARKKLLQPAF